MTGIKKRSPTNKEFKTNFQKLASTATKKGHLTDQTKKADDNAVEIGTLVRIVRDKMYENGWEVKVGTGSESKTYMCSYGDGVLCIPESTVTDQYLVPKEKTEVEVSIDKKSKIYTIKKIKTNNTKPIALYDDLLTISTNTNTNTNGNVSASIEVSNDSVNLKTNSVKITSDNEEIDLVKSHKTVKSLSEENESVQKELKALKNEKDALWERIESLESRLDGQSQDDSKEGE